MAKLDPVQDMTITIQVVGKSGREYRKDIALRMNPEDALADHSAALAKSLASALERIDLWRERQAQE